MTEELRSVVAVFRHGDRSPKQKMKMKIKDERILNFFKDCKIIEEIKLKKAKFNKYLETYNKFQIFQLKC